MQKKLSDYVKMLVEHKQTIQVRLKLTNKGCKHFLATFRSSMNQRLCL